MMDVQEASSTIAPPPPSARVDEDDDISDDGDYFYPSSMNLPTSVSDPINSISDTDGEDVYEEELKDDISSADVQKKDSFDNGEGWSSHSRDFPSLHSRDFEFPTLSPAEGLKGNKTVDASEPGWSVHSRDFPSIHSRDFSFHSRDFLDMPSPVPVKPSTLTQLKSAMEEDDGQAADNASDQPKAELNALHDQDPIFQVTKPDADDTSDEPKAELNDPIFQVTKNTSPPLRRSSSASTVQRNNSMGALQRRRMVKQPSTSQNEKWVMSPSPRNLMSPSQSSDSSSPNTADQLRKQPPMRRKSYDGPLNRKLLVRQPSASQNMILTPSSRNLTSPQSPDDSNTNNTPALEDQLSKPPMRRKSYDGPRNRKLMVRPRPTTAGEDGENPPPPEGTDEPPQRQRSTSDEPRQRRRNTDGPRPRRRGSTLSSEGGRIHNKLRIRRASTMGNDNDDDGSVNQQQRRSTMDTALAWKPRPPLQKEASTRRSSMPLNAAAAAKPNKKNSSNATDLFFANPFASSSKKKQEEEGEKIVEERITRRNSLPMASDFKGDYDTSNREVATPTARRRLQQTNSADFDTPFAGDNYHHDDDPYDEEGNLIRRKAPRRRSVTNTPQRLKGVDSHSPKPDMRTGTLRLETNQTEAMQIDPFDEIDPAFKSFRSQSFRSQTEIEPFKSFRSQRSEIEPLNDAAECDDDDTTRSQSSKRKKKKKKRGSLSLHLRMNEGKGKKPSKEVASMGSKNSKTSMNTSSTAGSTDPTQSSRHSAPLMLGQPRIEQLKGGDDEEDEDYESFRKGRRLSNDSNASKEPRRRSKGRKNKNDDDAPETPNQKKAYSLSPKQSDKMVARLMPSSLTNSTHSKRNSSDDEDDVLFTPTKSPRRSSFGFRKGGRKKDILGGSNHSKMSVRSTDDDDSLVTPSKSPRRSSFGFKSKKKDKLTNSSDDDDSLIAPSKSPRRSSFGFKGKKNDRLSNGSMSVDSFRSSDDEDSVITQSKSSSKSPRRASAGSKSKSKSKSKKKKDSLSLSTHSVPSKSPRRGSFKGKKKDLEGSQHKSEPNLLSSAGDPLSLSIHSVPANNKSPRRNSNASTKARIRRVGSRRNTNASGDNSNPSLNLNLNDDQATKKKAKAPSRCKSDTGPRAMRISMAGELDLLSNHDSKEPGIRRKRRSMSVSERTSTDDPSALKSMPIFRVPSHSDQQPRRRRSENTTLVKSQQPRRRKSESMTRLKLQQPERRRSSDSSTVRVRRPSASNTMEGALLVETNQTHLAKTSDSPRTPKASNQFDRPKSAPQLELAL